MKTLRVELADLEGIPHGSAPAGTRAEITAAYTGVVALTDGTLIPNAIKAKTVASSGVVNFSVYPSDSPDVREEYRGFGVTVTAKVQSFNGTVVTARRTVVVPDSGPSTVHLGNLAPADPLPPQWTTVGDLVGDIEAAAGTAEWAGITDKPESFPPTEHDHAMGDVTGLVDQISGEAPFGEGLLTFGPGGDVPAAAAIETALGLLSAMDYLLSQKADAEHVHTPAEVGSVPADDPRLLDTGWRLLSPENGWTGEIRLRRFGPMVHFRARALNGVASTSSNVITLPSGFRPGPNLPAHGMGNKSSNAAPGSDPIGTVGGGYNQLVRTFGTTASWVDGSASIEWMTSDPWPTILPGTPA